MSFTSGTAATAFSLQNALIAVNNGNGTYGTVYTIPSCKLANITDQAISDKLEGNSQITARASQTISVEISVEFGGIDYQTLAIIEGVTTTSSTGGIVNQQSLSNNMRPIWGLVANAYSTDGGEFDIWIPNLMVMGDLKYGMEFGKLTTMPFTAMAIYDAYKQCIIQRVWRSNRVTLTLPPAVS